MKFKIGDAIFFNWNNPYIKIIRLFNKIKYGVWGYGHVGIITRIEEDKGIQVHEAIGNGFTRSWYPKEFIEGKIGEGTIDVKRVEQKLVCVEDSANGYLGRGYGFLDIIGIGVCFLFGWKGMKITGASKLICSEAVARVLYDASNKEINFEKEFDKPYDLVTPMDIYLSNYLKPIKVS